MSSDEIADLFEGLDDDEVRILADHMLEEGKRKRQAFRLDPAVIAQVQGKPAIQQPDYDAQEAAEIAAIKVRGPNYALQKRNITQKYAQLRSQPAPVVDAEIEKVANDPRALMQLYKSRLARISSRGSTALHEKNEIAAPFRRKGLNV